MRGLRDKVAIVAGAAPGNIGGATAIRLAQEGMKVIAADLNTAAAQAEETTESLDDLGATFAVALLKLGLATSFVEQKYSGFARDVEEKRQRVLSAMMPKH